MCGHASPAITDSKEDPINPIFSPVTPIVGAKPTQDSVGAKPTQDSVGAKPTTDSSCGWFRVFDGINPMIASEGKYICELTKEQRRLVVTDLQPSVHVYTRLSETLDDVDYKELPCELKPFRYFNFSHILVTRTTSGAIVVDQQWRPYRSLSISAECWTNSISPFIEKWKS
jgi:hypothetical protein